MKNSDECELYCVAKGFRFFRQLSPRVKEGTPCLSDLNKVCIGGTCKVCTILASGNLEKSTDWLTFKVTEAQCIHIEKIENAAFFLRLGLPST